MNEVVVRAVTPNGLKALRSYCLKYKGKKASRASKLERVDGE